jgi:hypothetical protein
MSTTNASPHIHLVFSLGLISLPLSSEDYGLDIRKGIKKTPKGISESSWSLHIGSFWETHFINPQKL